jgi:hypothetical protein
MTLTATPIALTAADLEAVHYGIAVCCSGEDGDMIALGHHGKRKALAAFNRHCRVFLGLANIADDHSATAADYADDITELWGVPRQPNEEERDNEGWKWALDDAPADAPGAIPYTFLRLS